VEGVYVSNHGGRQLDHGRGALDVLPEVVKAVDGRATVIVDGGFMRGTDVVKGIALGAQVVGLGRLTCMGLAAAGENAAQTIANVIAKADAVMAKEKPQALLVRRIGWRGGARRWWVGLPPPPAPPQRREPTSFQPAGHP
jgi:hypothetical protein